MGSRVESREGKAQGFGNIWIAVKEFEGYCTIMRKPKISTLCPKCDNLHLSSATATQSWLPGDWRGYCCHTHIR